MRSGARLRPAFWLPTWRAAATAAANTPNYADSKAKREAVLADRAQVDLDEKLGLLVSRAKIEAAIFDAGRVLQRDLLELGAQLAERLASMSDPREIAALLETEHRRELNEHLERYARQNHRSGGTKTFVAVDPETCPFY